MLYSREHHFSSQEIPICLRKQDTDPFPIQKSLVLIREQNLSQ